MFAIGEFARHGRVSVRMPRHYDAIGLLEPACVDAATGYRFYEVGQLSRLNRIVALKNLGFTLQQVAWILDQQASTAELRGMLKLRHHASHPGALSRASPPAAPRGSVRMASHIRRSRGTSSSCLLREKQVCIHSSWERRSPPLPWPLNVRPPVPIARTPPGVDRTRGLHSRDGQAPPAGELFIDQLADHAVGDGRLIGMHVHQGSLPRPGGWPQPVTTAGTPGCIVVTLGRLMYTQSHQH
jgi:DNA-binding transcriptional MerR regulator